MMQPSNYGGADMLRKFEEKRATTAKTKEAMMVGLSHTSGDVHPLLQAAEQFLREHYATETAVTAQIMAH